MISCWDCQMGNLLAFLGINNDKYQIRSIDKLHYTLLTGPFHDKWHTWNVNHDAAKGFESCVSCKLFVHLKRKATYAFRTQNNHKCNIQQLSGSLGSPWALSWALWWQLNPRWLANPIWQYCQVRRYSIVEWEYETASYGIIPIHRICWHMINIQVGWRILRICLESRYDSCSTAHLPIPLVTSTL